MAREKLSVLLGAAAVDGVEGAIAVARCMLRSAGAGHTAAIFTGDPEQAVLFGAALDYYRIVVNGDPTNGAVGRGHDPAGHLHHWHRLRRARARSTTISVRKI